MPDTVEFNINKILQGLPLDDEASEICDFSLVEQNAAMESQGITPTTKSDYKPIVGKNVIFIVAVVLINDREEVLMMQEAKESCAGKWYLPAGRMEQGESICQAAKREVLEETGLEIECTTLLMVECASGSWIRYVLTGKVLGGVLKTPSQADQESLQAKWIANLNELTLRSTDITHLIERARSYILARRQKDVGWHTDILPALKSHNKLLLRLVIVIKKRETNKTHVLLCEKTAWHLPTCELNPAKSFHSTLRRFMIELFGAEVPQHKPHGLLSIEHSPNNGDGACFTLLVAFRAPVEEVHIIGKCVWHEISDDLGNSLLQKLSSKNATFPLHHPFEKMFSSGNRNKENQNYPTQWALNPSAYQNVSSEHVDWAALAQQWIMMKESVPPEHPAAGIGNRKENLNEGGEAPMDVEKEDAEEEWPSNENSNTTVHESWNWQQWGAWPNNWNGPPPAAGIVSQPASASSINKAALLPTPYTHFAPNTSDSNSAHSTDYQSYEGAGSSTANDFGGSSSGYWTNSGNAGRGKHSIKSNRTHRKGFSSDVRLETSTEPVTLDAAKRRQLPAWIREGLEKMEREKQKQLDKERERLEREEILNRKKEEKEEVLELLRAGDGSIIPPKSKFDSDSGDSADENRNGNSNRSRLQPGKSRQPVPPSRSNSPPLVFTEEERMSMVRRAMTEVLLQVTSSEIDTICQEEMNRFRGRTTAKKGGRPAAPSAGPFAAGTLGLGMYGGGSSDSESEVEGPDSAPAGDDAEDNDRRNASSFNNTVNEDDLDSKRQLLTKGNIRKRQDFQNKRPNNAESCDAGSSDNTADDGKEGGEQVDTTRSHGSGSSRSRNERRRRSSSSNSNSSTSSNQTSSSETVKNKRKGKKSLTPKKKSYGRSPKRHRRSSSSQSDDESSSGSKTSDTRTTSSRDVSRRNQQFRRRRSRSVDSDKRRSAANGSSSTSKRRRTEYSRSVSTESESRGDSHRRRTDSSTSSRTHNDRSRRERSASRSRQNTRSRRSRSRNRRDRRSRTRSRDRRDSYRSRRRSRSRSRSRSGGGKRTRGH